jgi:hypothetical protein
MINSVLGSDSASGCCQGGGSWVARPKPWEVNDELWAVIEPLLAKDERRLRYPGRKRLDDRLVLQGILLVLHTGIS